LIQIRGITEEKAVKLIEAATIAAAEFRTVGEISEELLPDDAPVGTDDITDNDDSNEQAAKELPENHMINGEDKPETAPSSEFSEEVENDELEDLGGINGKDQNI